jgi:uncharacterized integral membrane protein
MDADDPPRKNYGLKPRVFERVNTGTGDQQKSAEHDVYAMLQQNRVVEQQSGLNEVRIKETKSRRKRDFWSLLVGGNLLIVALVVFTGFNVVSVIFGLAGIIIISLGLTWIMWFVMDDY